MTFEEARKRVTICNGHVEPKKVNNSWICGNCGVGLKEDKVNKCGFRHNHTGHSEKKCIYCKQLKPLDQYYYRSSALDNYDNYCKECARNDTNKRYDRLKLNGQARHIWLPTELWNMVNKVKGKMTYRDFIILACRKEAERRLRDITLKNAIDAKKTS